MDYDSISGADSACDSAPEFSDDDGKILCTCGCKERLSVRQKNQHLKKARKRALKSKNLPNLDETEPMDVDAGSKGDLASAQGGNALEGHAEDHLFDNADDVFMNHAPDDTLSDAPSSTGSWYKVGTPPPTPPPPPSDLSDDDVPSDEDGYHHVTAEDYRKYDRWYAEDRQDELDEMVAETLTEKEMDSIKMMAIRQFGHISIRNYERIQYSFCNKVRLLTLQRLGTRVAALSGVTPLNIDCCINVCHAFTEKYANETECSSCHAPRYDAKGQPRKVYQYIPTIPRFQALFNNPDLVKKLLYRHEYPQEDGAMDDFFDSAMYKDLCGRNIIIDGEDTGIKFFSGKYDIATSVLSDGVQIFQHACQENATCWPIIMQILNFPPTERIQLRNTMPLCIIPGPKQPKDFDSFLAPFVHESQKLACRDLFWLWVLGSRSGRSVF